MTNLLIVESPAKSKTLRSILGAGWNVQASLGHITELAHDGEDALGFTISSTGIECRYQPRGDRGKKVITQLRAAVKRANMVYIASDPDREGEAIGFHLVQQLKLKPGQYRRVTYTQITDAAVKTAIANARNLDMALIGAQQARQCLDKLVGYKVSPLLWGTTGGKSAGRVQSPALHLVCQREREIQSFKPTDYWSVQAQYTEGFSAFYLGSADAQQVQLAEDVPSSDDAADAATESIQESRRVTSLAEAERLVAIARAHAHSAVEFAGKQVQKSPPPPFTTSSLQQAAGVRCNLNSEQTMAIAQQLFEGVDLPKGRKALITYHRTDSIALSPEFCGAARDWLTEHDPDNVPQRSTKHREKEGVQGAHEAIRPNYLELTPDSVETHLSPEQFHLYDLIWKRAIASQCAAAQLQKSLAVIQSGSIVWEARGSVLLSPGYTKYWNDLGKDSQLPTLRQGQTLTLKQANHTKKQTQPPSRYTEPKLVQALEKLGIGRPSTYATTMKVLKEREYVRVRGKALIPTVVGMETNGVLMRVIADLNDAGFTAQMESALDAIAEGQKDWQQYLIAWNRNYFQPALNVAYRTLNLDPAAIAAGAGRSPTVLTEHSCPVCNSKLEEYAYQKDGQPKTLLRCSVADNREKKCKKVAYFSSRGQWWSPDFGELGSLVAQTLIPAASPVRLKKATVVSTPTKVLPKKRE